MSPSPPRDQFNGWEILHDAPDDQTRHLPPPAAGRFVIAREPPALDGVAALRGEHRTVPGRERLALAWENRHGEEFLHDTNGFLLRAGRADATWLPEGWDMDVFPAGWSLSHLERWFAYALDLADLKERPDLHPGSDHSPGYAPTPRGLVAHAHLIVRHLDIPGAPSEPRHPMDRHGCIAELRELRGFLRRALHPTADPPAAAAENGVEAILERSREADRQRRLDKEQVKEARRRQRQVAEAFDEVKSFTFDTLYNTRGTRPDPDDFYNEFADRVVALMQVLAEEGLANRFDDLEPGTDAKQVAVEVFRRARAGDRDGVVCLLREVASAGDQLHGDVTDWLRFKLRNEILDYRTLAQTVNGVCWPALTRDERDPVALLRLACCVARTTLDRLARLGTPDVCVTPCGVLAHLRTLATEVAGRTVRTAPNFPEGAPSIDEAHRAVGMTLAWCEGDEEVATEPAATLRQAIRRERIALARMSHPDWPPVDWQSGADRLWRQWRELFPTDPPPPRPSNCRDSNEANDALDELLRGLEAMENKRRGSGGATPGRHDGRESEETQVRHQGRPEKQSDPASVVTTELAPKRSTERGEGRVKLVAALTKHHRYADGGCLNLEPVGNNELARLAGVAKRTASAFFDKEFQGHGKYKALCADAGRLAAALKLLNGEFAPHLLYGSTPSQRSESEHDADDE